MACRNMQKYEDYAGKIEKNKLIITMGVQKVTNIPSFLVGWPHVILFLVKAFYEKRKGGLHVSHPVGRYICRTCVSMGIAL